MGLFDRWSDSDGGDDGVDETSPWEGRGFIASAIVVGALAVCVLVWFFANGDEGTTPTTGPSATDSPSVTADPTEQPTDPPATPGADPTRTPPVTPPPNNNPGGCKAPSKDQRVPRRAPPGVSWTFEADMMIPSQRQAGPASQDADGLRHCFAHSPTGAVLAALVTLGQLRNPDLTGTVLERRVAPGPGRARALALAGASTTPRNDAGRIAQFTGFKVVDYLPSRAIISVAVRVDAKSVGSLPVTMGWSGGDWKMVLQPDGSINGDVQPDLLASLDGYVRFGGA